METVETHLGTIPALGFGTWQLTGRTCYDAVRHALELGYRHVDTAQMYGNEDRVGAALADSDVDRDEVFVTTKLTRDNLRADDVRDSTEASLSRLGTDHLDLLLIHWPNPSVPLGETLTAMAELREADTVRHVGVSNFPADLLTDALDHTEIFCDQVEYHPFLDQDELRATAVDRDVLITAYSPLAKGKAAGDQTLAEIGRPHGKTATQVALRWLLQQDHVAAIPRSSSAEHREANFDVFDFQLSDDDMDRIHDLGGSTRIIDPGFAPDW